METATVNVYHQEIGLTYWSYIYYKTEGTIEGGRADIYYRGKCVGERTPGCISRFDQGHYNFMVDWVIGNSIKELEENLRKAEEYTYVKF